MVLFARLARLIQRDVVVCFATCSIMAAFDIARARRCKGVVSQDPQHLVDGQHITKFKDDICTEHEVDFVNTVISSHPIC